MFFSDCYECELSVLAVVVVIVAAIDYYRCKRKWGENPKDAKWRK